MGNTKHIHAAPKGKLVKPKEAAIILAVAAEGDLQLLDNVLIKDIARMNETRPPLQRFHGPKAEAR